MIYKISEPFKVIGEGEYNLDDLKEIRVTDSYLGLDQNVRKCQNQETVFNCTTRHYTETLMKECGCLPMSIHLSKQVEC